MERRIKKATKETEENVGKEGIMGGRTRSIEGRKWRWGKS